MYGHPQRLVCAAGVAACLRSRKALAEQGDLAGVVRFMLADVKPLTEVVGWTPSPAFVGSEEPRIILLAKFG